MAPNTQIVIAKDFLDEVTNIGRSLVQLVADSTKNFGEMSAQGRNQTQEINTLKARQAVASIAQAISLVILCLWLLTLLVRAIFRCVTEKQEARQEEMVEMLERSLQERKSKRKTMAKPGPSDK